VLHLIIKNAPNFEDWKCIIEAILNKYPDLLEKPNKIGETPRSLDEENRYGIAKLLDEKYKAQQKFTESDSFDHNFLKAESEVRTKKIGKQK
jgi:hypothetical protein